MDAFDCLGLERRLSLDDDEISAAFRAKGKLCHPDSGGSVAAFESLEAASQTLKDPGRRLKHWLELENRPGDLRGSVSSELMSLFTELGELLQQADALIREREAAGSALAKAMLEARTQSVRDGLEDITGKLDALVASRVAGFEAVESGAADGWEVARDLAFLSKWQGQVRERFASLW
ncbi:DnaJ domain-containing protein [Haloferula rosea]|nr:DnaJ domain-containing protein [Haloferula rosea]